MLNAQLIPQKIGEQDVADEHRVEKQADEIFHMFHFPAGAGCFLPLYRPFRPKVDPQVVDFGSGQGRSEVETAGVAALRRGFQPNENAGLGRKMPFVEPPIPS